MKNRDSVLYTGADVHQRESQIAAFDPDSLLFGKKLPTMDLRAFIESKKEIVEVLFPDISLGLQSRIDYLMVVAILISF